ncbi:AimR family lysis-lysogeny pheromone receptor [Bacillus thuringiensis]|uniref:AimR family lysis-lysogeny pheromone receptor n=1 Tax=Bacillus thuringiensis TaxID=1428 RepID=UPI00211D59CC|nr:AimR family lysis-lysogeny pheromone receptor [Bacillus thuringiensis]
MNFYEKICNLIEDRDDLNFTEVASKMGVSKQYLQKFKNQGIISFPNLLKLASIVSTSNKTAVMLLQEWCLELDSTEAIKHSFEYAALIRNKVLLNKLLEKHKKESGTEIIKYLKKYNRPTDNMLNILIDIMKCYDYYHQKKFNTMFDLVDEVEKELDLIEESDRKIFLKECYMYRLAEVFSPLNLQRKNLESARYYANVLIEASLCTKTVSDGLYLLGMSFLVDDEERCLRYLQESYDLAKQVNDKAIEVAARFNLDVVKIYLHINLPEDSDSRLIRYQMSPISEDSRAGLEEILRENGEKDFLKYFLAVTDAQPEGLCVCFKEFLAQSNYFFVSLVAKEIKKRGDNSLLVQQMIDYNMDRGVDENEKISFSTLHLFNVSGEHCFV